MKSLFKDTFSCLVIGVCTLGVTAYFSGVASKNTYIDGYNQGFLDGIDQYKNVLEAYLKGKDNSEKEE